MAMRYAMHPYSHSSCKAGGVILTNPLVWQIVAVAAALQELKPQELTEISLHADR
jgi:hypothetical protein